MKKKMILLALSVALIAVLVPSCEDAGAGVTEVYVKGGSLDSEQKPDAPSWVGVNLSSTPCSFSHSYVANATSYNIYVMCVSSQQIKQITTFVNKFSFTNAPAGLGYNFNKSVFEDTALNFTAPYKLGVATVLYDGRMSDIAWSNQVN